MAKVVTSVTMITTKEISDEDKERLLKKYDADSIAEIAEGMEPAVGQILKQTFGDAEIELLDVNTEVES